MWCTRSDATNVVFFPHKSTSSHNFWQANFRGRTASAFFSCALLHTIICSNLPYGCSHHQPAFFFWLHTFPSPTWSALSIKHQRHTNSLSTLPFVLPPNLQLSLKLAGKKGASSWLSTLPLECHGFSLQKGDFWMLLLSSMVGLLRIFPPTVFVATHWTCSQLS